MFDVPALVAKRISAFVNPRNMCGELYLMFICDVYCTSVCVMAHMYASWHVLTRPGTYEGVMAHMNESWHI